SRSRGSAVFAAGAIALGAGGAFGSSRATSAGLWTPKGAQSAPVRTPPGACTPRPAPPTTRPMSPAPGGGERSGRLLSPVPPARPCSAVMDCHLDDLEGLKKIGGSLRP